eukprot:946491-Rhodomonas_salina.1
MRLIPESAESKEQSSAFWYKVYCTGACMRVFGCAFWPKVCCEEALRRLNSTWTEKAIECS